MPAIHIRDIPEDVLAALKRRAAKNSRSLQMEIRHHLIQLALEAPAPPPLPALSLEMSELSDSEPSWSREEIYDDHDR